MPEPATPGCVRKKLPAGAWFDQDPGFLSADEAEALMARLLEELPWEQRPVMAGDREVMQPRLSAWCGELPYRFSGQTLPPRPWHPVLVELCERLEALMGVRFNHVVVNHYRDGQDHMGFHADDEPELGRNPVIAGISLGARRQFVIRSKKFPKKRRRMNLDAGSLFIMGGTMQHTWYHAVPKGSANAGPRINLTFRLLHGPPGWRPQDDEVDGVRP